MILDRILARACYALWSVDIPYAQGNGHSRASGNPGGPRDLDPGIRRDDVASGHPLSIQVDRRAFNMHNTL